MIVRWGLGELDGLLRQVGIEQPLVVASGRWDDIGLPAAGRWSEIPSHRIEDAVQAAAGCDGVLAVGGGSAIDTAKAVSAGTGLPLVSVPTTYSGAEWTPYFGVRDPSRRLQGSGAGAQLAGVVYEPRLTLELPPAESGGTALNALAHCAEALYVRGHNEEADRHALRGAALIAEWLPEVLAHGDDRPARTKLLQGAAEAGEALALSGLALGHAMAQALGGRYGLPHGGLNAICLPAALRFNEPVAGDAVARFGHELGTNDPVGRVAAFARRSGYERLRDLDVPREELGEVAEATAARAGAKANPRPASPTEIRELLESVW